MGASAPARAPDGAPAGRRTFLDTEYGPKAYREMEFRGSSRRSRWTERSYRAQVERKSAERRRALEQLVEQALGPPPRGVFTADEVAQAVRREVRRTEQVESHAGEWGPRRSRSWESSHPVALTEEGKAG